MATQTGVLIRDQNLKFHFDGKEANVYKVQKKQGIGGRKALGDLTNSRKPSPIKASKRHYSKIFTSFGEEVDAFRIWIMTTSVMEEHFLPNSIAEEHMNMSKDYFLKTIGLHNDFPMQLPSCYVPPASSRKPKVQPGSPRKLELEEIAELMIEDQSPLCLKIEVPSEYKSSSCSPKSPKSSNPNAGPNYFVGLLQIEPNFTMIETPVLPKH
ncbi:hypothetical protein AAG906_000797 [Vitis piasezkii]